MGRLHPGYRSSRAVMATKYAFTQGLRELRFHLCSSGQGSEAARYFIQGRQALVHVTDGPSQFIPQASISYDETSQPQHADLNTGSRGCRAKGVGKIWARKGEIRVIIRTLGQRNRGEDHGPGQERVG